MATKTSWFKPYLDERLNHLETNIKIAINEAVQGHIKTCPVVEDWVGVDTKPGYRRFLDTIIEKQKVADDKQVSNHTAALLTRTRIWAIIVAIAGSMGAAVAFILSRIMH